MQTFTSRAAGLRGHQLRAVVFAVGSPAGVPDAAAFLAGLSELSCPVAIWAAHDAREALIAAVPTGWAEPTDGAWWTDEPVWLLDPERVTTLDQGRFQIDAGSSLTSPFGRLCSSLRTNFGSRVFLAATDGSITDDVFVRLLVGRGARLVETVDRPGGGATHAPVPVILEHLATKCSPDLADLEGAVA